MKAEGVVMLRRSRPSDPKKLGDGARRRVPSSPSCCGRATEKDCESMWQNFGRWRPIPGGWISKVWKRLPLSRI